MFNKSRPVPSKAALRALYQLAYISSGTAVGVATLCAEERRRKTRLLQAVAENAKRLRDSPRHVHNVALAAASAAEESNPSTPRSGGSVKSPQSMSNVRRRRAGMSGDHRGEKDAALPSQVDRGYAQVQAREQRADAALVDAHAPTERQEEPGGSKSAVTVTKVSGNRKLGQLSAPKQMSDITYSSWDARTPADVYGSAGLKRKRRPRKDIYATLHSLAAAKSDLKPSSAGSATAEADQLHVDQFFESLPWDKNHQQAELETADNFLRVALQRGDMPSTRSLLLWRFASNTSGQYIARPQALFDILVAHLRGPVGGEPTSQDNLIAVLEEHLATGRLKRLPGHLQLELCMEISEAVTMRSGGDPGKVFLKDSIASVWKGYGGLDEGAISKALADMDVVVRRRLKARDFNQISQLLEEWHVYSGSLATELLDRTFSHALNQKRLVLCSRLLHQRVLYSEFCEAVQQHYELFIKACHCKNLEHVLVSHFEHLHEHASIVEDITGQLSIDSQAILARAGARSEDFIADGEQVYQRTISESAADAICALRLSIHLRRKWKRTRELSAVQESFQVFEQLAARDGFPPGIFQPVLLAMVEIWADAGENDRALQMLSEISRDGQESLESLCAATTILAKRQQWPHLESLIDTIFRAPSWLLNKTAARSLQETLHQYGLHHTAQETWQFADDLLVICQPSERNALFNRRMLDIMLQCFVRRGELAYIATWLARIRSFGIPVTLNEKSAANLMTNYYLDHRPPHALFMGLCHDLIKQCHFRDQEPFVKVVKESLAYDMRHPTGNPSKMPYLRKLITMNADLLERTNEALPKPLQKADAIAAVSSKSDEVSELLREAPSTEDIFSPQSVGQPEDSLPEASDASTLDMRSHETDMRDENVVLSPSFADLRDEGITNSDEDRYHDPLDDGLRTIADMLHHKMKRQSFERDMIFALSRKEFDRVLELYESSLDFSQLPLSPRILEIAVEACLQNTPGSTEAAEDLLARAHSAGMNSTCAQGPLLLRELDNWPRADKKSPNKLRRKVIEYYESNERNGWKVQHHVATHAASILIDHNCALHGINLLNAVHQSEWATTRQFSITTMSVYLKGYVMLRHEDGIRWVISYVLKNDLRIDTTFLNTLRNASRSLAQIKELQDHRPTALLMDRLRKMRLVCSQKRMTQKKESGALGRRLVKCLTACSKQSSRADATDIASPALDRRILEQHSGIFDPPSPREITVEG